MTDSVTSFIANEANTLALTRASESEKQLHENNALLKETNKVFRRFVPSEFIRALGLNDITDVELGKHVRAELCVVFADLRNFSTLSESLDPSGVRIGEPLPLLCDAWHSGGGWSCRSVSR